MMVKELEEVVVRFSGDSGDGMQLAGNIFSNVSATVGNDICTFPDYPADIRAPQGSLTGVSGFQVHIGAGQHKSNSVNRKDLSLPTPTHSKPEIWKRHNSRPTILLKN